MYGYIAHTRGVTGHMAGVTAAAQLHTALQMSCKRVVLRADNTHVVHVGFSSSVSTATGTSTTAGFAIASGDGNYLTIDIQHTDQIWYIAASTSAGFSILIL